MNGSQPSHSSRPTIPWSTIGYGFILVAVAGWRAWQLIPGAFDLGFASAGLGSMARDGFAGIVPWTDQLFMGDHFSPVLLLIAPVGRSGFAGMVLVVLQALLVAVTVWIIRAHLVERGIDQRWRALVVAAVALHPALLYGTFFDFHANVAALPVMASYLIGIRAGKPNLALAAGVAATTFREDVALIVVLVALFNVARLGWRRVAALVAVGVASFAAWLTLATGQGASSLFGYVDLSDLAGTVTKASTLVFGGGYVFSLVLVLAVPWVLMARFDWRLLSPVLLVHVPLLAAESPVTRVLAFHYYVLIPVAFAIAFREHGRRSGVLTDERRQRLAWLVVTAWALLGPLGFSLLANEYIRNSVPAIVEATDLERASTYRDAVACVAPDLSVAVDSPVTPWVADREGVFLLPHPFEDLLFATGSGPIVLRRATAQQPDAVISMDPPDSVTQTYTRDRTVVALWWRLEGDCDPG